MDTEHDVAQTEVPGLSGTALQVSYSEGRFSSYFQNKSTNSVAMAFLMMAMVFYFVKITGSVLLTMASLSSAEIAVFIGTKLQTALCVCESERMLLILYSVAIIYLLAPPQSISPPAATEPDMFLVCFSPLNVLLCSFMLVGGICLVTCRLKVSS